MAEIFDLRHMGDALRNTGYKDLDSAVAEIIDNSIEANARDVFIILCEDLNATRGRKVVNEIAFLDNGEGMDAETLEGALSIGCSTRRERKGIGRFGVGLPQASLYASSRVEVYSWQENSDDAKFTFLDIEKITTGELTRLDKPKKNPIPKKYEKYLKFKTNDGKNCDFSKSGTLVIWKECDNLNPRSRLAIKDKLSFSLGQKFRYFISNQKCEIKIICDDDNDIQANILPNDPLFLMKKNCVLASETAQGKIFKPEQENEFAIESVFEPYTSKQYPNGKIDVPIKYYDKTGKIQEENVTIKFSIVKEKFYSKNAFPDGKNPGNADIGKHAKKLEGISIVRADREIDFGTFDFYENTNEPTHRWWGCEISFSSRLDEVFKVSNNKQHVELRKTNNEDFDSDENVLPIWDQLDKIIRPTIKAMYDKNELIHKGSRNKIKEEKSVSEEVVEVVENLNNSDSVTNEIRTETSKEERAKKLVDSGLFPEITNEDMNSYLNGMIHFLYSPKSPLDPAFDYDFQFGFVTVLINTNHEFYKSYLSKAIANSEFKIAFELFLGAFGQSKNETDGRQLKENNRILQKWQTKLNEYIDELQNPSSN